MWELDHKEGWVPNNWCFHTVVLESPLDSKEIKPVNPKGNQPWIFIGRIDAEAEAPILWHPMQRVNSLEKTLMLRKTEGKRRRGQQRMRWLDGIADSMDMNLTKPWVRVDREAWHATVHGVTKSQSWLGDWQCTFFPCIFNFWNSLRLDLKVISFKVYFCLLPYSPRFLNEVLFKVNSLHEVVFFASFVFP